MHIFQNQECSAGDSYSPT